jgi:hypothetical protein
MATIEQARAAMRQLGAELQRDAEKIGAILDEEPVSRCEVAARKGTGEGVCDRPLDKHGQCDRAADHLDR